jgi:molybdenum cofactor synthesis domain-containing protein
LKAGQIYDVNRFTLAALLAAHGGAPVILPPEPDVLDALSNALDRALDADVIVFSGGSSVGERDLMIDLLQARGEILFHGIAVKPGKPTLLGRVKGKPVIGMPGNPTSCLSNGYLLLVPMLRTMARLPEHHPRTVRAPLARRIVSTTGRHQFYTVRIEDGTAVPAFKGSGDITSMAHADGYVEIPAAVDIVEAGEPVDITLF